MRFDHDLSINTPPTTIKIDSRITKLDHQYPRFANEIPQDSASEIPPDYGDPSQPDYCSPQCVCTFSPRYVGNYRLGGGNC